MKMCKTIILLLTIFYLSSVHCVFAQTSSAENNYLYSNVEYLHWKISASPISVPLITQNNNPNALGIINEPGTSIIIGPGSKKRTFRYKEMNGVRLTLGSFLDPFCIYALEANIYGLGSTSKKFTASSFNNTSPVINIPFRTVLPVDNPLFSLPAGSEDVLIFRRPNIATAKTTYNQFGTEINFLYNMKRDSYELPFVLFAGCRNINVKEKFILNDSFNNATPGSIVNVRDSFTALNNIYGFQIGGIVTQFYSSFFVDIKALMVLAGNNQKLKIRGETNINNQIIIQDIGLFAEPSNIGKFRKTRFVIIPETSIKLGFQICPEWSAFLTYSILCINKILRASAQLDRNINLSQNPLLGGSGVLAGPREPQSKLRNSTLVVQGISIGIEF